MPAQLTRRSALALFAAIAVGGLAACGSGSSSGESATTGASAAQGTQTSQSADAGEQVTLRLGYFPNITHRTALGERAKGIFADKLGPNVKLETYNFTAGPKAMEAIFANALDATYVGPNPAINAYAQSKGDAVRVVSGATSG